MWEIIIMANMAVILRGWLLEMREMKQPSDMPMPRFKLWW